MFTLSQKNVNAYSKVGIESDVACANPHRLISMLFEGARLAISTAKLHMQNKDIAAKGEAISKAISIINDGLRASLDIKAGGDLAEKLDALYEYMSNRLVIANLKNQPAILEEVGRLLSELHGAWQAITPKGPASTENHGQRQTTTVG